MNLLKDLERESRQRIECADGKVWKSTGGEYEVELHARVYIRLGCEANNGF